MKLHVVAFGCQMSAADSAEMARPLRARGFSLTPRLEEADALIVNTCTVRQHAEDRAVSYIGRLAEWKFKRPERLLIVAGCAAERLGGWLQARFPFVDLVAGARSIERYPEVLEQALRGRFDWAQDNAGAWPPASPGALADAQGPAGPASAYVTIMRGCNYSCSYCIVPAVRGRELYRPAEAILEEARRRVQAGAQELVLLGQTVNSWHGELSGRRLRFPDLLRLLDGVEGLERVRFMSPHPHFADSALAAALAECRTACAQLHLPAQSGSDRVLGLMRRNYTAAGFLEKAAMIRRAVPGVAVSTDIIVGFPTETEEDFARTLELVEALEPAWAYTFKYSPRAGTESASRPDDVPEAVKEERLARLNERTAALARAALQARVGRKLEVLGEAGGFGRSREGFKVRAPGLQAGRTAAVRATAATDKTILGEIDEP